MKRVSPHRNSGLAVILFATALVILWGSAAMAMNLNSPAFQQNGDIPSKYTCEGEDVSPPLAWAGVPNGAKSLVLIIDDPDAPDATVCAQRQLGVAITAAERSTSACISIGTCNSVLRLVWPHTSSD